MKKGKPILEEAVREIERSSTTSPTRAGQSKAASSTTGLAEPERIEAINQVFALFRLNYHNQYYKAFGDTNQLSQIKKLWLESLFKYPVEVLLLAARSCIEDSEYLPTLHRFLSACNRQQHQKLGLPEVRKAYMEACMAQEPKSAQVWSHPVVYHAGTATGWYTLAHSAESKSYPIFEQEYNRLCGLVAAGEELSMPVKAALAAPETRPAPPLLQRKRLRALRKEIGL